MKINKIFITFAFCLALLFGIIAFGRHMAYAQEANSDTVYILEGIPADSGFMIRNINTLDSDPVAFNDGMLYMLEPQGQIFNNLALVTILNYGMPWSNSENLFIDQMNSKLANFYLETCQSKLLDTASKTIGSTGGIISLSEFRLNIPNHALENNVRFTIKKYYLDCSNKGFSCVDSGFTVAQFGETYVDTCENQTQLKDYYCGWDLSSLRWDFWNVFSEKVVKSRHVNCTNGCYNESCLPAEETAANKTITIFNETTNQTQVIELPPEPVGPS